MQADTTQQCRLVSPREIVAFLQNPWFKPGTSTRTILKYQEDVITRRRILGVTMTGRRLRQAFEGWYDEIWWDNANPRPVFEPDGVNPPDVEHIWNVVKTQTPQLIITFGLHARDGVQRVIKEAYGKVDGIAWLDAHVMHCHHPNARFKNFGDLSHFALAVKRKTVPCL